MCVRVCVCVCACDLREDVNVVMNQEKKLVIGAIDRNHLMKVDAILSTLFPLKFISGRYRRLTH